VNLQEHKMKVLIACESSGVVREAFRKRGHDAWSCDTLPPDDGSEFHFQEDIIRLLMMDVAPWDLMIAHPPCTYLCSSGLHWNKRVEGRAEKTEEALGFVKLLLNAHWIPKIALENPVGCISTRIRKYDQMIQPWMFGDNASKKTCLWLKGLPSLSATKIIPPGGWSAPKFAIDCIECPDCGEPYCEDCEDHYADCGCIGPTQDDATYKTVDGVEFATLLNPAPKPVWANQTPSGQNKLGPSADRWKERSKTYQGIADAMANQWG
jgi:hypothetical protein